VIKRGEIWWAELSGPRGSEPGFRRPVLIVQADSFNRSRIATVIVVAITSNLGLAEAPGNVLLSSADSKLPRDSVVNVSQVLTLDRRYLTEMVGCLSDRVVETVESGLRLVLNL
jgi:mRNA interferase MazF